MGFVVSEQWVDPIYIELFIKSARARIDAYAPATAQKNINLTTLEDLVVPLCSLAEQQVLVSEVDARLSALEVTEREIDEGLQRTIALRQSILKKAFSGQLVRQDPSDEPAAALLDRLRNGSSEAKSGRKTRRKQFA